MIRSLTFSTPVKYKSVEITNKGGWEEHQAPESSSSADLSKSFVEGATVSYSDRFVAHNRRVTFEDQNLQDVCYSSNGENNVSNALIIDESFAPNFSPDEM